MKDGVDAVLDASAIGGEHGALGGEIAHAASLFVGDPDGGEEVGAEELSEHVGVDLVSFDSGLCDGLGAERVGNGERGAEGLEDRGDGPGVGGGFQDDVAIGCEGVGDGEVDDGVASGGEAGAVEDLALVVDDASFDFFLMEVEAGETLCHTLCERLSPSLVAGRGWVVTESSGHGRRVNISCPAWRSEPGRTRVGLNGAYLCELEAQSGGPRGRLDTTAGSKPISVLGLPQGCSALLSKPEARR